MPTHVRTPHAHTQAVCTRAQTCTHNMHMNTNKHMRTHMHVHTREYALTHAHLLQTRYIHMNTQAHVCMHTHAHTLNAHNTHKHMYTCALASSPGSRLIKCMGEEESLVSTALWFKLDPRHSSGSGFHRTLSHHARMDDIISCQVSIKSYCSF